MMRWTGLLLLLFLVRCDCDGDAIKPCEGLDRADQLGAPCSEDFAGCMRVGTLRCDLGANGNNAVICDLAPPPAEICNAADDDCDGQVDEDLGGDACAAGDGICAADGQQICMGGQLVCDARPGQPEVETCNTLDDDCDGTVDEIVPVDCQAGVGACTRVGQTVCNAGVEVCGAQAGEPQAEICNTLDDDCDGRADEVEAGMIAGCALANVALHDCIAGGCTIAACADGFRDEDGDSANGCECSDGVDAPDADGIDSNCDGVDGMADASIFVDPVNGRDDAPGSLAQPIQSLSRALTLAADGRAILLAEGDYTTAGLLTLPAGVRIHGGYRPDGPRWLRPFGASRITGHFEVLRVVGDGSPTLLDAVTVEATDAPPGLSSVAVIARGDGLRITGSTLIAGDGGHGNSGAEGLSQRSAETGLPGFAFDARCTGCPGIGGEAECPNADGARGGVGNQDGRPFASRGGNGGGGLARQGLGGDGGPDLAAPDGNGEDGADGRNGEHGVSSAADPGFGRLDPLSDAWLPGITLSGGIATPGGGGGGGGGGGRRSNQTGIGGGGGGAGAGGCNGDPGSGATGGGASIALQIVGGQVELIGSVLIAGRGGDGGTGGAGGGGRLGGEGAPGAAGCDGCGNGGHGGRGGNGGCGGMAGGGASGHAVPILRVSLPGAPASASLQATETRVGQPGTPGAGGSRRICPNVADDGALGLSVPQACCAAADLACVSLAPCP